MAFNYNYSIIIPHKDTPELLDRLLYTIPDREDTQVIVCDDCSSSDNFAAVVALKKKYPQIEIYQTDSCGGGGKARNLGLRYATGKYLIFADADDYFNLCFPSILDKYANTNYDIVYFTFNSVDCETYQNKGRGDLICNSVNQAIKDNNLESLKYKYPFPVAKFISAIIVRQHNIKFQETPLSNDVKFSYMTDHHCHLLSAENLSIYCATQRKNSTAYSINWERITMRLRINVEKQVFLRDVAKQPTTLERIHWDYQYVKRNFPLQVKEYEDIIDSYGFSSKNLKKQMQKKSWQEAIHYFKIAIHHSKIAIRFLLSI